MEGECATRTHEEEDEDSTPGGRVEEEVEAAAGVDEASASEAAAYFERHSLERVCVCVFSKTHTKQHFQWAAAVVFLCRWRFYPSLDQATECP